MALTNDATRLFLAGDLKAISDHHGPYVEVDGLVYKRHEPGTVRYYSLCGAMDLELIMRRYERASTLLTSNRPVDDWGKLLGDTAAVTALLDRLLHHAHVIKCGPRSWRTKLHTDLRSKEGLR